LALNRHDLSADTNVAFEALQRRAFHWMRGVFHAASKIQIRELPECRRSLGLLPEQEEIAFRFLS